MAIWVALKQLRATKNSAVGIVLLRLVKTKIHYGSFFLTTLLHHLTELGNGFHAGYFNFAQMKASVELCINKLSDAAVNPT